MTENTQPPRWISRILHGYCPDNLIEEIEGDLLENYAFNAQRKGIQSANLIYAIDVVRFFNPTTFRKGRELRDSVSHLTHNHLTMWKNYFTIARRNFWRQKESSTINLFGLASGLAACILIGLFAYDEFQFDRHHPKTDSAYRIVTRSSGQNQSGAWAGSSPAIGPALQEEFPEITENLRLYQLRQKMLFVHDGESFLEEKGFFAEPTIFNFFDLPLIYGDPSTALKGRDKIVLSEKLANKYFGSENPVGSSIKVGPKEATVTGVLKKRSPHFHLDFDFLISFQNLLDQVPTDRLNSWVWQDFISYIMLAEPSNESSVALKLPDYIEENAHPQTLKSGFTYYVDLQPLKAIHLHSSHLQSDVSVRGNYQYVMGLIFVGVFILLIACINFINLSTAKAVKRSKEVGIRKIVGAGRKELVFQFLAEAIFLVFVAMVIACLSIPILLPYLNEFTGKQLHFNPFSDLWMGGILVVLTLCTALLSGIYPAFVLSGLINPRENVGKLLKQASQMPWLRKGLVVGQFTLSILLIIGVLVIFRQVQFMNNTNLGFSKKQLLHFPLKGSTFSNYDVTKDAFLKVPGVEGTSTCFGIPGDIIAGDQIIVPGEDRRTSPARIFAIDHDYISTIGLEVIAGRDFSRDFTTDISSGFIINETAVSQLAIGKSPQEAIGRDLEWQMWSPSDSLKKGKVIGVVKDFHYSSLHDKIQTTILHIDQNSLWKMVVRISTEDVSSTITGLTAAWDEFETGYPLDYQFVDESFRAMYEEEQKLSSLLWIFTLLAIIIASIGIFGLSSYSAQQRNGEIGIRKVLGASVLNIVGLLSKEYIQLIGTALIIAIPLAWYIMDKWLRDFSYRVDLDGWTFALAGLITIAIAGFTVSYQNIRAAHSNPVNAIRAQ